MALIRTAVAKHLPRRTPSRALSARSARPVRLHPQHRLHLLFGANTDVGKSVVSTGLVRAAASSRLTSVNYIKPLQCGGSDESFVWRHRDGGKRTNDSDGDPDFGVNCKTLFSWQTPASPHLASRWENMPVSDDEVLASLRSSLKNVDFGESHKIDGMESVTIIESAGGVLSPSSSSPINESTIGSYWGWSTQADLYAPLEIPVVFVGDGKLGGISVTLASLESLWSRGYRIDAVIFIEGVDSGNENYGSDNGGSIQFGRGNTEALREYTTMQLRNQVPNVDLNNGQKKVSRLDGDSIICLPSLPPMPVPLDHWYESNQEAFLKLHHLLCQQWRDDFVE